jgi:tRNA pseudouridine55 synthase
MNGILLIDKPAGITSHTVVSKLRRKLGTKKIGHAGTLDPTATGLMVLCIGYATKISSYVTDLDKAYQCRFELGKVTTTYDIEGEVVSEKNASHVSQADLLKAFEKFKGDIAQKPPIYSAIKINGRKLYQYARSNTEVEIPTRNVSIRSLKLLSYENPFAVLEMECSKGTYVRSLVHDVGQELGVGASVEKIHRIMSSPFTIDHAVSLDVILKMDLEEIQQRMISVKDALAKQFKIVAVQKHEEALVRNGVVIKNSQHDFDQDSLVLFVSADQTREIAIATWNNKRGISYLRIF